MPRLIMMIFSKYQGKEIATLTTHNFVNRVLVSHTQNCRATLVLSIGSLT